MSHTWAIRTGGMVATGVADRAHEHAETIVLVTQVVTTLL